MRNRYQGEWVGNLQEMKPGRGYRLFTSKNGELIYPPLSEILVPVAGQTRG
jgi:hypothetical protein